MEKKLSYKVPSLRLLNLYSEESFLTSATGGIDPWDDTDDPINF